MKREIIACVILLSLIGGAVASGQYMQRITSDVADCLSLSQEAASEEDFKTAIIQLQLGMAIWRDEYVYTSIFIGRNEFLSTNDVFYDLEQLLYQRDAQALLAAYSRAFFHLEAISKMEQFSLESVF